jgi:Membrane bound O-acyl transferase family
MSVYPRHPSQIPNQTRRVRYCLLPHAIHPSLLNDPTGHTLFDPRPKPNPALCQGGPFWAPAAPWSYIPPLTYSIVPLATLTSGLFLHQPDLAWPPLSDRPWTSMSIIEYWSFRWHQFFRCMFVVYGARPGGALLVKPGACIGAFSLPGVLDDVVLWGLGRGKGLRTTTGFFMLTAVGGTLELAFERLTGRRVGEFCGWVWTMCGLSVGAC